MAAPFCLCPLPVAGSCLFMAAISPHPGSKQSTQRHFPLAALTPCYEKKLQECTGCLNLPKQACSCPAAEHKPLATSCSTGVRAVQTEPSAPAPSHTAPNGPCHASLLSSFSQERPDKPQHPGVGKKGTGTWQGYLSWQLSCQPSAPGQAAVLRTNREVPPPAAPALPSTTFPVADNI